MQFIREALACAIYIAPANSLDRSNAWCTFDSSHLNLLEIFFFVYVQTGSLIAAILFVTRLLAMNERSIDRTLVSYDSVCYIGIERRYINDSMSLSAGFICSCCSAFFLFVATVVVIFFSLSTYLRFCIFNSIAFPAEYSLLKEKKKCMVYNFAPLCYWILLRCRKLVIMRKWSNLQVSRLV